MQNIDFSVETRSDILCIDQIFVTADQYPVITQNISMTDMLCYDQGRK